jgi:hypothetical protein
LLTDVALQKLKPAEKLYKKGDRDGLYAAVLPSGAISFRFNYRINGRAETLTIGRYEARLARNPACDSDALEYGMDISLAEARALLAALGGIWNMECHHHAGRQTSVRPRWMR